MVLSCLFIQDYAVLKEISLVIEYKDLNVKKPQTPSPLNREKKGDGKKIEAFSIYGFF